MNVDNGSCLSTLLLIAAVLGFGTGVLFLGVQSPVPPQAELMARPSPIPTWQSAV